MKTLIETIKDKIFDLNEKVKILNCHKEDLLTKLCDNQYQIRQLKDLSNRLQIDLNQIPTPRPDMNAGCMSSVQKERIDSTVNKINGGTQNA